jgi:hypothetical protein
MLQKGCEALWWDNPDIESLMLVVEKCIFSSNINIRKKKEIIKAETIASGVPEEHGSLIVDALDPKAKKLHSRLVENCDINVLFDLLSKSLSIRRNEQGVAEVRELRSEEELIDSDDETPEDEEEQRLKMLKFCHKRVDRLVGKAIRRLKEAGSHDDGQQTEALIQLLGVLRFFQELRKIESDLSWVKVQEGETLFPIRSRSKMLEGCFEYLFGWGYSLYERVVSENPNGSEELTQLISTIVWLYWDSKYAVIKRFSGGSALKEKGVLVLKSRYGKMMLHIHRAPENQHQIMRDFERFYDSSEALRARTWFEGNFESTKELCEIMNKDDWENSPTNNPRLGGFVKVKRRTGEKFLWGNELLVVSAVSATQLTISEKKPRMGEGAKALTQTFRFEHVRGFDL